MAAELHQFGRMMVYLHPRAETVLDLPRACQHDSRIPWRESLIQALETKDPEKELI